VYFLFLDESGSPPKRENGAGKYLVIGGVIIPEGAWHGIARDFRAATVNVVGELKWKHFGTSNKDNSISHLPRDEKEKVRRIFLRS
jgi:hypothetical protein